MPHSTGHVFWIFGLSGAGKSTLARLLTDDLRSRRISVLALDGDSLRGGLCHTLGFTDSDRAENLRRAAEVAKLGIASNLCVVASFITPLEQHRELVTNVISAPYLSFIYVNASLEVCRERDVKGLYARAKSGDIRQMTGLSSAFEAPSRTDLILNTGNESPAVSSAQLILFAQSHLPQEHR